VLLQEWHGVVLVDLFCIEQGIHSRSGQKSKSRKLPCLSMKFLLDFEGRTHNSFIIWSEVKRKEAALIANDDEISS
jgi:hypothetical protein